MKHLLGVEYLDYDRVLDVVRILSVVVPSVVQSNVPSVVPSGVPSVVPSDVPSVVPSVPESARQEPRSAIRPTPVPSVEAWQAPWGAIRPTPVPSVDPSLVPFWFLFWQRIGYHSSSMLILLLHQFLRLVFLIS